LPPFKVEITNDRPMQAGFVSSLNGRRARRQFVRSEEAKKMQERNLRERFGLLRPARRLSALRTFAPKDFTFFLSVAVYTLP
jgi:hypothetical protein